MALPDRSTNTYMLSVSTLSVQNLTSKSIENDLSSIGDRIQAVLDFTPGQRRNITNGSGFGNGSRTAVPGGPRSRPRRRRQHTEPPSRAEICTGWSDLLGEVSSSSRRVRVAKGGHFGAKASASGTS